jgi:hypothetical protein
MSEPMQRRLVMIFCLHCNGDLEKLDDEELCLALRISPKELEKTQELFRRKGFISEAWVPKNWRKRQAPSDPTAAERMRRMRAQQAEHDRNNGRNVTRNVTGPLRVEEEVETETEGEKNSPLPPAIVLGPEFTKVGEWAIQLAGDVSWGSWVSRQGMCGHSAANIRKAIEISSGAGKLSQAYVASKLQGWASEGGPPKPKGENNGKTSVQQRPEDTVSPLKRPDLPRKPEFEHINQYWDDIEAGRPATLRRAAQ